MSKSTDRIFRSTTKGACARWRAALASLAILLGLAPSTAATELNRIVLRVNDHIATLHDFEQRRAERVGQLQRAEVAPEERRAIMSELGERVLREMYEELLLLSRADQLGLRAGEAEVEQAFRDTVDSLGIEGEEELQVALAASGITEEVLRRQIRRGMVMQQVIGREVRPRVRLGEEELRRYYRDHVDEFQTEERWQLRDAVVLETAGLSAEREAEIAEEIRDRVLAGEDLATAAGDFVELEQVAVIDIGWVVRGDLEPALEQVATELIVGDLSAPVGGRGGLHILHLLDYEAVEPKAFAEVEEEISTRLQRNRFGREMQAYLKEIEGRSHVAAHPPAEAEGFRLDLGSEVLEDADELFDSVAVDPPSEDAPAAELQEPSASDSSVAESASAADSADAAGVTAESVPADADATPDVDPAPAADAPDLPTDAPTRELPPG